MMHIFAGGQKAAEWIVRIAKKIMKKIRKKLLLLENTYYIILTLRYFA
jgi:hypothetical protein